MNQEVEGLLKTLPRKVKVGAYDWKIKIEAGPSDERWGLAEPDKYLITVWPDEMPSTQLLVGIILHELLHALFYDEWLETEDKEEAVVTGTALGLVALYRDNPKLLTWIKRGLKSTNDGRS